MPLTISRYSGYKIACFLLLLLFTITKSYGQNFGWLKNVNDSGKALIWNMIPADSGDIICVGNTNKDIAFGDTTLVPGPHKLNINGVMLRIAPDGKAKWVRQSKFQPPVSQGSPNGYDNCWFLAAGTDSADNIYVAGRYRGTILLGNGITLGPNQVNHHLFDYDLFIAKYDRDGNALWAREINAIASRGSKDYLGGGPLIINKKGDVTLVISYKPSLSIGGTTTTLPAAPHNSVGLGLIQYDSSGQFKWAKHHFYNSHSTFINSFASSDHLGNIYIGGRADSSTIGGVPFNGSGAMIVKFDSTGTLAAIKVYPNTPNAPYRICESSVTSIIPYPDGRFMISGQFGDSLDLGNQQRLYVYAGSQCRRNVQFYAYLDGNLNAIWAKAAIPDSPDGFTFGHMVPGPDKYVYQFGNIRDRGVSFDHITIPPAQDINAGFIIRIDTTGKADWHLQATDNERNIFRTLLFHNQALYITGYMSDSLTIGNDSITFNSSFNDDVGCFLARVHGYYNISRGFLANTTYQTGTSLSLPFTITTPLSDPANEFIAELSDSSGSFDSTTYELGRITAIESDTISCIIPQYNLPSGNHYKVRISSTHPSTTNNYLDDTLRLIIYSADTANTGPDRLVCKGQPVQLTTTGGTQWLWSPTLPIVGGDSTEASPWISVDTTTTFRVIISDSTNYGPTDTDYVTIFVRPELDVQVSGPALVCGGQSGVLRATASGGDSTQYQYEWWKTGISSPIGYGDSILTSASKASEYYVILTDSCTALHDTAFFTLHIDTSLEVFASADTTICSGQEVMLNAWGDGCDSSQLSYEWSIANSPIIISDSTHILVKPATSTQYQIVVTDMGTGIRDTGYVHINVLPDLQANVSGPALACGSEQVRLTSTFSGGDSSSYQYAWYRADDPATAISTGDTLITAAPRTTNYYVVLSDGCTVPNDTSFFTLQIDTALEVLPPGDTTICLGHSLLLYADGVGCDSTQLSYQWSVANTNLVLSDSASLHIKPDSSTLYRVVLTDNGTGIHDTGYVYVTVDATFINTVRSDTTICRGQSVDLFVNTQSCDTSQIVHSWYRGTQQLNSKTKLRYSYAIPPITTTYTIVTQNLVSQQADTNYVTITVNPPLELTAPLDTTLCKGKPLQLIASGNGGHSSGYLFSWEAAGSNFSDTGAVLSIIADTTTTFGVTLLDGCTPQPVSASVTVTVREPLRVTVNSDTTICRGQVLQLVAQTKGGDTAYQQVRWLDDQDNLLASTATVQVSPTATTTYRAVLSDGCTPDQDTASVTVLVRDPLQLSSEADTTICQGQAALLNATATGGDSTRHLIQWLDPSNNLVGTQQVWVNPTQTTVYTGILSDGCSVASDTVSVTISVRLPLKVTTTQDTTICYKQSATLTAHPSGGDSNGYRYQWSIAGGPVFSTSPSAVVQHSMATTYIYMLVLEDGCTVKPDTAFVRVHVRERLRVQPLWDDTLCLGEVITLQALGSGGVKDDYQYTWDINGQATIQQPSLTITPQQTATYQVTLEDGCSHDVSTSATITVLQNPVLDFTTDTTRGCAPLTINFENNSQNTTTTIWYPEGWSGTAINAPQPSHTYTAPGTYAVGLKTDNLSHCEDSLLKDAFIEVFPTPEADFTYTPDIVEVTDAVTFTSKHPDYTQYTWDLGDGHSSTNTDHSFQYQYLDTGTFHIQHIVEDQHQCLDTTYQWLTIGDEFSYFIPNAFTPNGNVLNPIFAPVATGIKSYELAIINRSKSLLFETSCECAHACIDASCGWDGTFKGQTVPEGVYAYQIIFHLKDGTKRKESGTVQVLY